MIATKNKKLLVCLTFFILLVVIPSFLVNSIHVDANTNDKALKTSSRSKPIYINSPLATTYTSPSAGYYPATYGFEDTQDGYVPSGWTEYSPGNAWVKVASGVGGHNKILRLYDPWQWWYLPYAQAYTTFSNQQFGTIEFWFRTTMAYNYHAIEFRDGNTIRFRLKVDDGRVWANVGYWQQVSGLSQNIAANTWYRFKIDFETSGSNYAGLSANTYKVTVNEDVSQPMNFENNGNFNKLLFSTGSGDHSYSMYIDAVGYSWDPYYEIMDNKYQGLLLEFEPDGLEYMSYNLDGQSREISGDIVLPMPKSGAHEISVYGYDAFYIDYFSDIRSFSVNIAEKIGVLIYARDAGSAYQDVFWSEMVESNVLDYVNFLSNEGYSKIYVYRDVGQDNGVEFDTILDAFSNKRVDYQDIIFFYLWGHGNYYSSNSHVCLAAEVTGQGWRLSSAHFRGELNTLYSVSGTNKIGLLVQSCKSGGFEEDFRAYPFLAITSSAKDRNSYSHGITHEGIFSAPFWDSVWYGHNAVTSYNLACDNFYVLLYDTQPQINDISYHQHYSFFA
ncbi:MAG: hypothetical protein ACTSP9_08490 [Promethearchaeota archaeon]